MANPYVTGRTFDVHWEPTVDDDRGLAAGKTLVGSRSSADRARPGPQAKVETPRPMASYDLSALAILIVDPNHLVRRLIADILRSWGVRRVEQAASGADAIKILAAGPVDLVVTEANSAPVTGFELVKIIRAGHEGFDRFTPVIMMSAHSHVKTVLAARDSGVNEFLVKPFSAQSLYRHICAVIENPRPIVSAPGFLGPDRRRKRLARNGTERRRDPAQGPI